MEVEGEWTDENILELVADIRQHSCIWDPRDMNHRRKRKKQEVYFLLGNKYQCAPEEVSRKWANLLQSFRNLRRKMTMKSAYCAEEYTPRWFAFEAINDFMKDVYTPRPGAPTEQGQPRTNYSDSNSDLLEDEESLDLKYQPPVQADDFVLADESEQPLQTSENLPADSSVLQSNSPKRPRSDMHAGEPSTHRRLVDTYTRAPIVTNDCYESFGTYIASMLRAIGPPEAFILQQRITVMVTNKMCAMENFLPEENYQS